jgi:transposase
MPPRTVSRDLKAWIPTLFFEQDFTVDQICIILGVKKSLVYKSLQYFHAYGTAYNPHSNKPGRSRILSHLDIKFIIALVNQKHCIYLSEICQALSEERGLNVSITTLSRTLQRLNFTQKSVSIRARERNEILRAAYMNRIADIITNPNMLMFIDESARNRHTSGRRKGWAFAGKRCILHRFFVCGQRFSILPVLTIDGIITHDIIPGSVTSECFLQFLQELVIPLTNPYPGPRSVLVLDNCNIHHSENVRTLVEDEAQCKLIFLPPYSPDLNPIEQAFSSIKAHLRRHWEDFSLSVIDTACHNITTDMAWSFIRSSGYVA